MKLHSSSRTKPLCRRRQGGLIVLVVLIIATGSVGSAFQVSLNPRRAVSALVPTPSCQARHRPGALPPTSSSSSRISSYLASNKDGKHTSPSADSIPLLKSRLARACTTALFTLQLVACLTACWPVDSANAAASDTDTTTTISSTNSMPSGRRYWTIQDTGSVQDRVQANTALLDYAVGTINTMYYDHYAGAFFSPRDFFGLWRRWLNQDGGMEQLQSRQGAVEGLRFLVGKLHDPFSKYLTQEELRQELVQTSEGFLGLGAMVEGPGRTYIGSTLVSTNLPVPKELAKDPAVLAGRQVQYLPVITALAPDSPAERAGLTVGDRIVAVGTDSFLGKSAKQVTARLAETYQAENYLGHPDLTVAKPVFAPSANNDRELVVAFHKTRVRLTTAASQPSPKYTVLGAQVAGGDAIVHYELLTSQDSIFDRTAENNNKVGYIRLTRFSRASTSGFVKAVEVLEDAGATSFIIDLRNNYGGVIQEAMLMASTLLRDPHSVLCYTMNSRGGFTPHDVEEYAVDGRYPGYLLSQEPKTVTVRQIKQEDPDMFRDNGIYWVPPSSYASIHEQTMKRGIHRTGGLWNAEMTAGYSSSAPFMEASRRHQLEAQKNVVLLINEGTASSAEVFASALHDNGRTVALVGTKTFGKGLIQHTFPMPDGGGLRLTVAEYLTPALNHVTKVGGAQFDAITGEWVGGGIRPDIPCESRAGIPGNVGADLCVGVALDALEEAEIFKQMDQLPGQVTIKRLGGSEDGTGIRRVVTAGIVKVSSMGGDDCFYVCIESIGAYYSHCFFLLFSQAG